MHATLWTSTLLRPTIRKPNRPDTNALDGLRAQEVVAAGMKAVITREQAGALGSGA
jgi:hypothetical protein